MDSENVSLENLILLYFRANTYFEYSGLRIVNEGVEPEARDPFFRITRILVIGPDNKEVWDILFRLFM